MMIMMLPNHVTCPGDVSRGRVGPVILAVQTRRQTSDANVAQCYGVDAAISGNECDGLHENVIILLFSDRCFDRVFW